MRDKTEQQIVGSALRLFLEQGIKKTSMEDIAHAAGVTRVTIYRHFAQKEHMVQAAFDLLVTPFRNAQARIGSGTGSSGASDTGASDTGAGGSFEAVLNAIALELSQLPQGDLPTCLGELQRVHPKIHAAFTLQRHEALIAIFDHLYTLAEAQGRLRPGLNRHVVEIYFQETVINVLDSTALRALGLSPIELFSTVKRLFLFGLLQP